NAVLPQAQRGLRKDQRNILLEPFTQAVRPMRCAVGITRAGSDPDFAVADFDRRSGYVVRPGIERAAGREIEARVMPMARKDPVLDRAAMQRKAQVRATIIECEDPALVMHDDERSVRARCDDHFLSAQLVQRANADEFTFGHGPSLLALTRPGILR